MREKRGGLQALVAAVVAVLAGILALWLFTLDIHAGVGRSDGESDHAFCGSAYDVALIKHDGYMGGEYPANQDEIDRDCVRQAKRVMLGAGAAAVLAVAAGIVAIRNLVRRPSRTGTVLTLAVVSLVPIGLGLAWHVTRPPELGEIPMPSATEYGAVKPTSEAKANFLLWVSNQSFSPETVGIDVQLDGVIVANQKFDVGFQHTWTLFPLRISPGPHELIVVSDTGVKLVKHFSTPAARRFALLEYWGEKDEGGKRFAWRVQKRGFLFA